MKKVGIISCGHVGNISSVKNAVEKAGGEVVLINDSITFNQCDSIVLPGVGSFPNVMETLKKNDLCQPLIDAVGHKPILGICLGMQILCRVGFEFSETKGLGLFDGEVRAVASNAPIPHMGFNTLNVVKDDILLKGLNDASFYFMHSYEVVNYTDVLSLTCYEEHTFVSSIQKNNVYGVQFHPENSRDAGIELFKNFLSV